MCIHIDSYFRFVHITVLGVNDIVQEWIIIKAVFPIVNDVVFISPKKNRGAVDVVPQFKGCDSYFVVIFLSCYKWNNYFALNKWKRLKTILTMTNNLTDMISDDSFYLGLDTLTITARSCYLIRVGC